MKKIPRLGYLILILVVLFGFMAGPVWGAGADSTDGGNLVSVRNNQELIEMDVPPVLEKGRILIPVEPLCPILNIDAVYGPETGALTLNLGDTDLVFHPGSPAALVGTQTITLDVSPRVSQDQILIPLRFLVENLGLTLSWDEKTKTAQIQGADTHPFSEGIPAQDLVNRSADKVNQWWKEEKGYDKPPYLAGSRVTEFTVTEEYTFARVYDGEISGMYGGWVMKGADLEGLTPAQIKDKFALPALPKYVVDVKISPGTRLRGGITNEVPEWGKGGGVQFDLMGQRTGEFLNSRLLPGAEE
ncbi:copper amine oxidase N-terminal domain-containing protein [Candidatus Formimonas warabiya]|uniref:Copper amine oxidase-like N-terminal domain-containing protein n=1 Tax=Formimonas warabiya TaxID=1761012 RepID=A0A3G1KTH5_FORW1|nr:copper amine oxidase N-terminal domain-containing protein [Candidatus Formimonas warabiya]ATW25759.1 hypothetical protein DCMF_14195 [Candidatus Formimonas warabiya]